MYLNSFIGKFTNIWEMTHAVSESSTLVNESYNRGKRIVFKLVIFVCWVWNFNDAFVITHIWCSAVQMVWNFESDVSNTKIEQSNLFSATVGC